MTIRFRPSLPALAMAGAALLTVLGGAADARVLPRGHISGEPVLVELYTAQGCATCPKANGVIGDLSAKKGLLPLTFSVDYWDYLGWEDTLAKSEFTERQRAYAQRLKVREIYTPEIVVDGAVESSALDPNKLDGLIAAAQRERRHGPHVQLLRHDTRVMVSGPGVSGDIWLVRYDPKPESVKIKAGDNKGQTVVVRNAVRELKRLGVWRGAAKTYPIPKAEDAGLKTVVMVQAPKGGRVLAFAKG